MLAVGQGQVGGGVERPGAIARPSTASIAGRWRAMASVPSRVASARRPAARAPSRIASSMSSAGASIGSGPPVPSSVSHTANAIATPAPSSSMPSVRPGRSAGRPGAGGRRARRRSAGSRPPAPRQLFRVPRRLDLARPVRGGERQGEPLALASRQSAAPLAVLDAASNKSQTAASESSSRAPNRLAAPRARRRRRNAGAALTGTPGRWCCRYRRCCTRCQCIGVDIRAPHDSSGRPEVDVGEARARASRAGIGIADRPADIPLEPLEFDPEVAALAAGLDFDPGRHRDG